MCLVWKCPAHTLAGLTGDRGPLMQSIETDSEIGAVQGYGGYPPQPPPQGMYVQQPHQGGGAGAAAGQGCLAACLGERA